MLSVAKAEVPNDLNSYCFEKSVSLSDAHQTLKILLLPKDIVDHRIEYNCLDIVTSPDRGRLFEKYLGKRYHLQKDTKDSFQLNAEENKISDCRIDLKTTTKSKVDTSKFKIGEKNIISFAENTNGNVSMMELLLGSGKSGEISIGEETLIIICQLIGSESANLIFSYLEKNKASVNSEVTAKKGEWINVGSILKDLNEKTKISGIPQSEISKATGKSEVNYELRFK